MFSVEARVPAGRYELLSLLGRGRTAEVWHGFDRRGHREVAVKVMQPAGPGFPVRFEREIGVVARVTHPAVVPIHDVGPGYLVMELMRGGTLAGGALPVAEAVRITRRLCDGLAAIHAAGSLHCDVKPTNILIDGSGAVKLADAWISSLTGAVPRPHAYSAPEQLVCAEIEPRTDVYALGCVLYTMLTGGPPFVDDDPMELALRHIGEPPPRMPIGHLDPMLAKDPADRPTVAQVRAALR